MRFRRALLSSAVPLLLAQPAAAQAGRPTVSVAGTVVDESGMPIQGVAVSPLGAGFIARSAERGQFQLPALTSGTYRVVARRTGFVPDTVQVELAPDDSVSLWIVLRRIVVRLGSGWWTRNTPRRDLPRSRSADTGASVGISSPARTSRPRRRPRRATSCDAFQDCASRTVRT